jgi:DNA-directed RNA polymerase subunit RPC12/RpoP
MGNVYRCSVCKRRIRGKPYKSVDDDGEVYGGPYCTDCANRVKALLE